MFKLIVTVINTLCLAFLLTQCSGIRKQKVDLIIHNATIYKVDEKFSTAEAMAIAGDSIVAIGAEREILNRFQAYKQIDARKQFIYPGFIDAHAHFTGYALGLGQVNLIGTNSWEECLVRVQSFIEENPNLTFISGRGWDQNDWNSQKFPHKSSLDSLFPDVAVMLTRVDGHAAIVNTKALNIAGVTIGSAIKGGLFEKDESGLTGMLIDKAIEPVAASFKKTTIDYKKKYFALAQQNCFAAGITSLAEAGLKKDDIETLQQMYTDSILTINQYIMLADDEETLEYYMSSGPVKTDHFTIRSIKCYVDGALGSRGAALLQPYSDDTTNQGLILYPISHYDSLAKKCFELGYQLNAHCIGDSANRLMLSIYGNVLKGVNDLRWRIEHAQVVHPLDLEKFAAYTIIPSVQPTHATSDMYWAEKRLGKKRISSAYAFKDLMLQNGIIALGTDFPVEDISPLKTFYASVFRQDLAGLPEGGYFPNQKLSREETIKGMTIHATLAQFEENEKGSLEVGKRADFVLLNQDLMTISAANFDNLKVQATFISGKQVYEAH